MLLSASGKLFRQDTAQRFAQLDRIVLLCGRYEGVDERVAEHLATDELSIGDFVLSGGELAAALVMDAVTRLIPGALGNEDSSVNESFSATEAHSRPRIASHESRITSHESRHFSTSPITRALRNSAAGRCPKFCWAAITKKFAAGARRKRWRKRGGTARICWRANHRTRGSGPHSDKRTHGTWQCCVWLNWHVIGYYWFYAPRYDVVLWISIGIKSEIDTRVFGKSLIFSSDSVNKQVPVVISAVVRVKQ